MNKALIVASAVVIALGGVGYWYYSTSIEPGLPIGDASDTKTYRNEEFGFEFEYPSDWEVKENTFKGYYTKFSAVVSPIDKERWGDPILIHIVSPEFVENSFRNLEKTKSSVAVDGVHAVGYVYDWKGGTETVVIAPIKEYEMILGTNDHYENEFNDFIESFRFTDQ